MIPMRAQILNTAGPYLQYLAATFPTEAGRAVRHVAWFLRDEMRRTFDAPGGRPLKAKTNISNEIQQANTLLLGSTRRGRKRAARKAELAGKYTSRTLNRRATYPALGGSLRRLIRYQFNPGTAKAEIGWLNNRAARIGESFQAGKVQTVTPRMRRLYNIIGRRVGRQIRVPERPVIQPVYEANRNEIPRRMEQRILEYLQKANSRAAGRVLTQLAGSVARGVAA
jgi:hypothetical protein